MYTVKDVAQLSKVTIKTLHHYHKIGLLLPSEITDAGYRLYGRNELERLQQILLYRELDFTLDQIKTLLDEEPDRLSLLAQQEKLMLVRRQRLDDVIGTLRHTITSEKEGEPMDAKELFKGLATEEAWQEALHEHNEHLKAAYQYEPPVSSPLNVEEMNAMAAEAASFMAAMAEALRSGVKVNDGKLRGQMDAHLAFLNAHGHATTPADFAAQTRFFLSDDFHLGMLESQQTGLAYYLAAAAEAYAAAAA
ncbi:MerR family transcriptional regulator [Paenibacillus sp. GCM10023248]|uniref:MerR family transcriptional regulator n=1 Tax=Bacillales TaxID=1385 RepID=UPI002377E787|nr:MULTISPECIES: MerR family transcriptional regulator [Bacillales]MDD9265794.1 MerR family transcriptional regulator [Paenibacillus sp. MAHUQ-63]MDR6879034.1 DNA-binding transcriptional MerR regulator [Bacillus sp. 3255]